MSLKKVPHFSANLTSASLRAACLGSLFVGLFSPGPALAQSPAPSGLEARWMRNVRQITSTSQGLKKAGEAYFSPDARRICFQAIPENGEEQYQIYVMNADGSDLKMVSTGTGATTCAFFHPDGKRLLFAANHHDPRPVAPPASAPGGGPGGRSYAWSFFPGMDLFEYEFASGKLKRLTEAAGYDAEGSYSPDGKSIVFCSMRDGDQEIYVCDADGKNPRRITNARGYDGGPFFSPDGKRIIYRSDRKGDGNLQIFSNSPAGGDEQPLTGNDVLHWCPYWHPSGKWLIYTRGEHPADGRPVYDLFLLSSDGKQQHQLTDEPAFDGLPVFSPDGSKLMWTSKRNGLAQAQVFIADFIGLSPAGELAPGIATPREPQPGAR